MHMRIQKLNSDTKKNLLEDLLKRSPNNYGQYEASVKEILDKVKEEKDAAVFAYTAKFDGAELTADTIEVTDAEIEEAYALPLYVRRHVSGVQQQPALSRIRAPE